MSAKARIPWLLRACALALLLFAWLFTKPPSEGKGHWILLDVSDSVRELYPRELGDLPGLLAPCLRALHSEDRIGLVVFGSLGTISIPSVSPGDFVRRLPKSLEAWRDLPPGVTSDFESAFRMLPGDAQIWLWSDGRETKGDLARWRKQNPGVVVSRLPFPAQERWDAQIRDLRVAQELPLGVEALARVEIWADSQSPSHGTLSLVLDGVVSRVALDLAAGEKRYLEFPLRLSREGEFPLEARWEGPSAIQGNDVWIESIRSPRLRSFLDGGGIVALGKALRQSGKIGLRSVQTGQEHATLCDALEASVQGLWWVGSTRELTQEEQPCLLDFLRRGGTLVLAPSLPQIEQWMRDLPLLAATLPWIPDEAQDDDEEVLLLLDRSGSMAGGKFEIAANAAWALARAIPARAVLRVASFAQSVDDAQLWKKKNAVAPEPIAITAGPQGCRGGTNLEQTLRTASGWFPPGNEKLRKKILLLSDGKQTVPGPSADGFAALARELREKKIELVALAVGEDPDLVSLRALTSQERNGRVVRVDSFEKLTGVFENEASEGYFEPGPHAVRLSANSAFPDLPQQAPALGARMKAKLRPESQSIYETLSGRPVLAMRREGLGVVMALAADPAREGEAGWMGDPGIWESLLLSLPLRKSEGELLREEDGAIYFPGLREASAAASSDFSNAELIFEDGAGLSARFWKQGALYRSEEIDASSALVSPFTMRDPAGRVVDVVRERRNPRLYDEWRGGGRSILPLFETPNLANDAGAAADAPLALSWLSRRKILLAALGAFLLSWVFPFLLALRRKGR